MLLFEEGPLLGLLQASGIDVAVLQVAPQLARVRKEEGLLGHVQAAGSMAAAVRPLRQVMTGYEVIYANTPKAFVLSAIANHGSRRPLIYHLRDILSPAHFSMVNRRLLVGLANCTARRVVANSQATADAFVEAGGDKSRVVVVPNGFPIAISKDTIADRHERRKRLREELGVAGETKLVALVGRLAEWKGQHIAIEALKGLPAVHLVLVGDALFGEGAYAQHLRHLVQSLGLAGRVHFLGFRQEVLPIMQGADVLIHTSIVPEPFGRVLVEGMLARCPVIATRGGGTEEIVADGITGLLIDPDSTELLANAIRQLLEDPPRAHEMARQAYRVALERYRLEPVVAKIDSLIGEVAAL